MYNFAKHNKSHNVFNVNTKGLAYFALSAVPRDLKYNAVALFINKKSKYGEHPVAVVRENAYDSFFCISLPKHLTQEVEDILASEEAINAIKRGECWFTIREYEANGKTCTTIDWESCTTIDKE